MATIKAMVISSLIVLVCIATLAPQAKAAVSCNQMVSYLSPCLSYVSNGGTIPSNCCNGIRSLYNMARTTPDRQSICNCLKSALRGIPYTAYNLNLAAGLPAKCGVNIPYKINPNTKCENVK